MKKLKVSTNNWSPEAYYRAVKHKITNTLAPCIELDGVYYVHVEQKSVHLVAATDNRSMSPVLLLESMNCFVKTLIDLLGEMSTDAILSQITVVYELIVKTFGSGYPSDINQQALTECRKMAVNSDGDSKLFPFVPSNLFGVVPSQEEKYEMAGAAAKAPLTAKTNKENEQNIFVDLTEYLTAVIDCDGRVMCTNIRGTLSTKSYISQPVEVTITLPSNITEKATEGNTSIVLDLKRFHHEKKAMTDLDKNFPVIRHVTHQGLTQIMDYHIQPHEITLPFSMYHNFIITPEKPTEVKLNCKLFCSLPSGCSPINWNARLPLPTKLVTVTGSSSLKSMRFTADKDKRYLSITAPLFPSQSHHSINVVMLLSEKTSYTKYEVPHLNMQFEISNLCISKMKICSLKVKNAASSSTTGIKKWVRYVTHCKDYQFHLSNQCL